jgi:hypothetical protein
MMIPLVIVGIAVFTFLGGTVVRLLWNWLLPSLFGFPTVTFWQALGLLALGRILFGGMGMHGRGGRYSRRRMGRWEHMTPEERERFREDMRARWGCEPPPATEPR